MEVVDPKKEIEPAKSMEIMEVTIDLMSRNEAELERACNEFHDYGRSFIANLQKAKELPYKCAKVTTLRTPCGQGTKTWNRYKLRVFFKKLSLDATHEQLQKVTGFLSSYPDVKSDLKMSDSNKGH
jgi:small subunit ribosomal protein S20e